MKSKKMPRLFFAAFLWAFSGSGVFGLGLEALVDPQYADALRGGERPVLVQFGSPTPRLIPRHDFLRQHIEAVRRELGPSVMVEILYLYRKPPHAQTTVWTAEEKASLYNELLALSTLAGIQYFSASRGGMRTLYENSQVIDGPATRRPLPDPVFAHPPAELSVYVRQKDLTFGDNVYQYNFFTAPGILIATQRNLTPLSVGPITAVGRNNLRSTVAILDAGQYILVYTVSMARAAALPGMRDRVGNSFISRAAAIIQWFSDRADRAFEGIN
ncbi:MAG: hypothetical protein FWC64_09060 [Treponema sp.]|nr:hypothetical protein [Treponema sp.]